jgi:hypothetical protein
MRKLLAIAILISFVAPASAERGFINGLGNTQNSGFVSNGSKATSFVPTPEQSQRHRAFFQAVIAEQRAKSDARNAARENEQRKAQIDRNPQESGEAQAAQDCTVLKTFAGGRCQSASVQNLLPSPHSIWRRANRARSVCSSLS